MLMLFDCQLQELKRKRRHRASLEHVRKDSEEVKVKTKSPAENPKVKTKSSNSVDDRRSLIEEKAAAKSKHKPSKVPVQTVWGLRIWMCGQKRFRCRL